MVFRTADGTVAYQLDTGAFGAWAPTGSTVYFFVRGEQGFIGELDSVGASGQAQTVVPSINGFFWPRATPDGAGIVYEACDDAGVPHIWRFDLATKAVAQLSAKLSSNPVFVTQKHHLVGRREIVRVRAGRGRARRTGPSWRTTSAAQPTRPSTPAVAP